MYKKIKTYYNWGGRFLTDPYHLEVAEKSKSETLKRPIRSDVINFLLSSVGNVETNYLEIGVRNPAHNFNLIQATKKYSVDPGVEFKENPVDFKLTSDEFFTKLREGQILASELRFDVIFIDGLHLAEQVERDIINSLDFMTDNGFIVLHDCNPPSEWHAREEFLYSISPAMNYWNGTTWKAFYKYRLRKDISSACVDSDWGVGILSKRKIFNSLKEDKNQFYEYKVLEKNRNELLNLISFEELKNILSK